MNELTFTWEPVAKLLQEGLHDLGHQHWLEGVPEKTAFPYDPDWEAYQKIEEAMMFRIIAVRWRGHLVGYAGIRIFGSMQSRKVICSYIQEYYIQPEFRGRGGAGVKLFRFIENQLRLMKVQHVTVENRDMVREDRGGLTKFFQFLGYKTHGALCTKSLTGA